MNKSELYKKLQNIDPSKVKELGLSHEEIQYIKEKLLNDKLGLTLSFTEMDNELKSNYILLDEIKELSINPKEKNNNLLIEGDNYHALKALQKANVKVDVIYIDPPYNTGKEFVYKDDFGVEKVVGQDDAHKHSKWLSFMKKRLELAKELLSDEGVIFVSIDDNEQAYLKVLMDEIFGSSETDVIIWNKEAEGKSGTLKATNRFRNVHEYICLGYKNKETKLFSKISEPIPGEKDDSANLVVNVENIKHGHQNWMEIVSPTGKKWFEHWKFDNETIKELISENLIYFGKDGNNKPRLIIPKDHRRKVYLESIINKGGTTIGRKDLEVIMGDVDFSYPKPVSLIKTLINVSSNKNSTILDFFAGSGTTGQAIMELNAEDGGNRRFILVTNNEMKDVDTAKEPEKGIARAITRERLFRVINQKGSKGEEIKWTHEKHDIIKNNSLKYLQVELLNKIDGEFEEIDKVVELYENEFDKSISIVDFKE